MNIENTNISIENQALLNKIAHLEKELSESRQKVKDYKVKFRTLFEVIPDAMFLADLETGAIIDVNPAAEKLLQKQKTELIGQHYLKMHPLKNDQDISKTFTEYVQHMINRDDMHLMENLVIKPDGNETYVEISAQLINYNNRIVIIGIIYNITKRKKVEDELKESSLLLEEIFNGILSDLKN